MVTAAEARSNKQFAPPLATDGQPCPDGETLLKEAEDDERAAAAAPRALPATNLAPDRGAPAVVIVGNDETTQVVTELR